MFDKFENNFAFFPKMLKNNFNSHYNPFNFFFNKKKKTIKCGVKRLAILIKYFWFCAYFHVRL